MLSLLKNKALSPKWYSVHSSKDKSLLLTHSKRENCGIVGNCPFQLFYDLLVKSDVINMPHNDLCEHYDNKEPKKYRG